ncbi:MAG: DUF1697 domain-containing protein [Saprospiraceae bacterium]|nr:DUF1697 domain-containing protein [Saprospiraceae bacterium]
MAKYIAFLRGINVGKIRIKMIDLKVAFEKMGCTDVLMYLQTGNVVFHADKTIEALKPILEKGLSDTFKYEAYVLLYPFEVLKAIIAACPYEAAETRHNYVMFISNPTIFDELYTLSRGLGAEAKTIEAGEGVLYWQVPIGKTLDTPFAKLTAKAKYKSCVTVRNINTLEKMI